MKKHLGIHSLLVVSVAATWLATGPLARADVVDLPVSFQVKDINRTPIPCSSDGQSYTIHGHLTGPRTVLSGAAAPTVTFYLHDFGEGEWFWRFRQVPGYDFAASMATAGQTSLTIATLGYVGSDRPPGMAPCIGSEADIAHQIVQDLLEGHYSRPDHPVKFRRVIIAGQSVGAQIGEIEAYSFGDIAGLAQFGWSDQGASSHTIETAFQSNAICATGGQPADGTSGPPDYVYYGQTDDDFKNSFFNQSNADPAVVAAATPLRARGPCGDIESVTPAILTSGSYLSKITVPVLLVYGSADVNYPPSGAQSQAQSFSGSKDVRTVVIDQSGHAFTLERTSGLFSSVIGLWLDKHWPAPPSPGSRSPSPTNRAASLRLVSDVRLIVARRGTFSISLLCTAPRHGACTGRIKLRGSRQDLRSGHLRPGAFLASTWFRVQAGHPTALHLRLTAYGIRALLARHRLAATMTGEGMTSGRAPLYFSTAVELRPGPGLRAQRREASNMRRR